MLNHQDNTKFDITLRNDATDEYGNVWFDVSYNFEIDYKVPYNITDISFCAARDISLNSAGDDFFIENDYVLSNKTSILV